MLVLVSGADEEYCSRVVDVLQAEAHRVVIAADVAARAQFLSRASPDAVIVCASLLGEVPEDLVQAVGMRSTPAALVTDTGGPMTSRFREVGFRCFEGVEDLGVLLGWLQALRA